MRSCLWRGLQIVKSSIQRQLDYTEIPPPHPRLPVYVNFPLDEARGHANTPAGIATYGDIKL